MSRAVEESNRRMLRARDAIDRTYAQPLDVPSLARMVHVSEAHFIQPSPRRSARPPTATCSATGSSGRCSQDLGFMRWLTVCVPDRPDHAILLERPGPPSIDDGSAEQLRELITRGAAGWVGF